MSQKKVTFHNETKLKKEDTSTDRNRLLRASISTVYNIGLQVTLRVITFVSNAFILRYISKDILGIINVRLLLLYTTIQFISREPFRRTCAPNSDQPDEHSNKKKDTCAKTNLYWQEIVNITFLSVSVGLLIGLLCSLWWYTWLKLPDQHLQTHYQWAILSIYLSVVLELLAEPFFIYGQRNDFVTLKVAIEGVYQLIRVLSHSLSVLISPNTAILGFAFSQLLASTVYSMCYVGFFVWHQKRSFGQFVPSYLKAQPGPYFNDNLWRTSKGFMMNTILKQFLTEGERYVMTLFAVIGLTEQGIYDVVNNLGSLPARLIFQQIEENAYLLFSGLLRREMPAETQRESLAKSLYICVNLVRFMFLLSLFLLVYGFNCAELALFIYGGQGLLTGGLATCLLQWHCLYILFIALNGILEAYSFAAMNSQQLKKFNLQMLIFSASFLLVSLQTTTWFGSVGFIMANCVNILLRIITSIYFIFQFTRTSITTFIGKCSPKLVEWFSFAVVFTLLTTVRNHLFPNGLSNVSSLNATPIWPSLILFVGLTGAICCVHLAVIVFFENDLVNFVRSELFSKQKIKSS